MYCFVKSMGVTYSSVVAIHATLNIGRCDGRGLTALFVGRKLEPAGRNQSPGGVVGSKIRQLVAPSSPSSETGSVLEHSERAGSSERSCSDHFVFRAADYADLV